MITAKDAHKLTFEKSHISFVNALLKIIEGKASVGRSSYSWCYDCALNVKVLEQIKTSLQDKGFVVKDTTPADFEDCDMKQLTIFWE